MRGSLKVARLRLNRLAAHMGARAEKRRLTRRMGYQSYEATGGGDRL